MNSWKNYFNSSYQKPSESKETISANVNFLIKELDISPGDSILDIGCGDGKYLIEFAKRDYNCTGIDFSGTMIEKARKNASSESVDIELIEAYAQNYVSENKFDAIISINQGAFCLLEDSDNCWARDMAILANMATMMPVAKKYAISFLNAFYLVNNCNYKNLDLFVLTAKNSNDLTERFYTPSEVVRMVNRIGLKADNIYSINNGELKATPASFNTREFMVIGHRKDHKGKSAKTQKV